MDCGCRRPLYGCFWLAELGSLPTLNPAARFELKSLYVKDRVILPRQTRVGRMNWDNIWRRFGAIPGSQ